MLQSIVQSFLHKHQQNKLYLFIKLTSINCFFHFIQFNIKQSQSDSPSTSTGGSQPIEPSELARLSSFFQLEQIKLELEQYIISMSNYSLLLEEFHIYQQQETDTHQEFAEIIDQVRNQKQAKRIIVTRKKEEKMKLVHQMAKFYQRIEAQRVTVNQCQTIFSDQQNLEEINHSILKSQLDDLEKQVTKMRKQVKQTEDQVAFYNRKENDVKQIKYSSKRQLENCYMMLKSQKQQNMQLDQKHDKIIQQLNQQKYNLEHENRFLADQLQEIKSLNKNYIKTGILHQNIMNHSHQRHEEVYSKRKFQQILRSIYSVIQTKKYWNGQFLAEPILGLLSSIDEALPSPEQILQKEKVQISLFYLAKVDQKSWLSTIMIILQLYKSITKNTTKLHHLSNNLNNKVIQLKSELKEKDEFVKKMENGIDKDMQNQLRKRQGQNIGLNQQVKRRCSTIFQLIYRQFKLYDKMKRILATLESVTDPKNEGKSESKSNKLLSINGFKKSRENFSREKRNSSSSNINCASTCENSSAGFKNNCLTIPTNRCINLIKKSSHQSSRFASGRPEGIISHYELSLLKSPNENLMKWEQYIKTAAQQDPQQFYQFICSNDLYRFFFQPSDYDIDLQELENEEEYSKKIFESAQKILTSLKQLLLETVSQVNQICNQIQKKVHITEPSTYEVRYLIESKGYFRRDNFKLLEKLEVLDLKKKGLYIPYRYGIEVEQQLLKNSKPRKELLLDIQNRKEKLSTGCRKARFSAPNSNYISSQRQRLNHADKKIRDLLKNAQSLRIKKKARKITNLHHDKSKIDLNQTIK